MSLEIFDPTVSPVKEEILFAPRPQNLSGLRVGQAIDELIKKADFVLAGIGD